MHTQSLSVSFRDTSLSVIDLEGKPWLSSSDLARALGYKRADQVSKIYRDNSDEFTACMSQTADLAVSGNINGLQHKRIRIFSPRGCHLVAMFARTTRAKEFRKWVLDVLDGISFQEPAPQPDLIDYQQRTKLWHQINWVFLPLQDEGTRKAAATHFQNRLRLRLNIKSADKITVDQLPVVYEELARVREDMKAWLKFRSEMVDFLMKEVIDAGGPWTPWVARKWREKMKRQALPERPDWQAMSREALN